MTSACPGAGGLRGNITISEKICPVCGREIEIFSCEPCAACECGFIAYNDRQSCIKWCAYARECVGEKIYQKFMKAEEM
ncbi:MAG: hypothetical protein LBS10_09340 [Gracilibacteraceae bacterium]|jgi:hypothetical protein|nr:hypothetical protein [Gracilibacteraceae bacterium]